MDGWTDGWMDGWINGSQQIRSQDGAKEGQVVAKLGQLEPTGPTNGAIKHQDGAKEGQVEATWSNLEPSWGPEKN